MTQVTNDLEGGTDGATITAANSGGGTATAFDTVSTPQTGATLAYNAANAIHGGFSAHYKVGATSGQLYTAWSTALAGPLLDHAERWYFNLAALPASTLDPVRAFRAGSQVYRLRINSSGQLVVLDAGNATLYTSTVAITAGSPFRLETKAHHAAGSASTLEVKLWLNKDSSASPDIDEALTGLSTIGSTGMDEIRTGLTGGLANSPNLYGDGYVAGAPDFVGPVVTASLAQILQYG